MSLDGGKETKIRNVLLDTHGLRRDINGTDTAICFQYLKDDEDNVPCRQPEENQARCQPRPQYLQGKRTDESEEFKKKQQIRATCHKLIQSVHIHVLHQRAMQRKST